MENSTQYAINNNAQQSLQDLWDEENKGKNILSEREQVILDKTFGKPTVYAPGVSGKPTVK